MEISKVYNFINTKKAVKQDHECMTLTDEAVLVRTLQNRETGKGNGTINYIDGYSYEGPFINYLPDG